MHFCLSERSFGSELKKILDFSQFRIYIPFYVWFIYVTLVVVYNVVPLCFRSCFFLYYVYQFSTFLLMILIILGNNVSLFQDLNRFCAQFLVAKRLIKCSINLSNYVKPNMGLLENGLENVKFYLIIYHFSKSYYPITYYRIVYTYMCTYIHLYVYMSIYLLHICI